MGFVMVNRREGSQRFVMSRHGVVTGPEWFLVAIHVTGFVMVTVPANPWRDFP